MQKKPLTPRQKEILDLVKNKIEHTGMPPTRVEISKELGFRSPNAAEEHLKALARKGYIEMLSGTSRGIRVIADNDEEEQQFENQLPLVGKVAAGEPILAMEHIESHYAIQGSMFTPPAHYLLRICGDSMQNIGILDGDLLAVHKTQSVRSGQVIIARIDDEVTVKRLDKRGSLLYLLPENDHLEPIVVDPRIQNVEIEGIAVGVIRNNAWM